MATLEIRKKSLKTWLHIPSDGSNFILSKFYCKTDANTFKIVEESGSNRREYSYTNITVYDDTDIGSPETFASAQALMLRLEVLKYTGFNWDGDIPTSYIESVVAGTNITIDDTDPLNPIISSSGGGGDSQTLADTLILGNTTDGENISISSGDSIILDNGSLLKKGTIDAGYGGANGIAQICAVGYELKWEAGRLYVMGDGGTTIREVSHNFTTTPSATDDVAKGFIVGSRWILDNGDLYICTDNTSTTAVWVLQTIGTVTSVGLTMPSAFSVTNSPITSSGDIAVTGAGLASQYIRGDGTLATLPTSASGGSSISYYLNGGTAASVATYYQMSKIAVVGTGVDFSKAGNGLISQWLTDVADPNRLEIPAGNWNFEMYMNASSSGGTPAFYVELLKYDGTTFTTIANSSAVPEAITGGTLIDLYLTSLAIPQTTLLVTDRLAIRVYIVNSTGGRTITMHTQDSHLCEIITNFAGGVTSLNGLTTNTQNLAVGTSGTDFAISSVTDTHTFNLPTASATNRGALSSTDWSTFNAKADINPRLQTVTSSATVTPTSTNDLVTITAQAAGLTIANPTGTMTEGQALMIRIKDNGTARSIAFGTNYRALGITLPTTTVISKTMYLGLIWNNTDTKFDVVGLNQEV